MTNLILCGGAGTRLWPLSRSRMPKQFYPLFEGRTIFEETVRRNRGLVDRYFVASNAVQMELARDQLVRCGVDDFGCLVEPVGRNTAPAIALVCLALPADELVFVTPSDHRITKAYEYARAVNRAKVLAEAGHLVTFGIRPSYPETGFGYIEAEGEAVTCFREKPDLKTAEEYVASGRFLWNSGMFVFRAGVFLAELEKHSPEVLAACRAVGTVEPTLAQMQSIPSISIDYAVMEKSDQVKVVAFDPGWSDLGSFDALFDEVTDRTEGNAVLGGDPLFVMSKNNLVVGGTRKIALAGVEDLLVIDTPDALLIVKRGSSQMVKDVVGELKKTNPGLLD
jgi:mannose-1-phosphate guanylyltransferase